MDIGRHIPFTKSKAINDNFESLSFRYHTEDDSKKYIYFMIDGEYAICRSKDINSVKANTIYHCDENGNSFKTGFITKDPYQFKYTKDNKEIVLDCFKLVVTQEK